MQPTWGNVMGTKFGIGLAIVMGVGLAPSGVSSTAGALDEHAIVDFSHGDESARWVAVNDDVMGGRSSSRLAMVSDSTAVFAGTLSLENRGGFASVRRLPGPYDLERATAIRARVKGDGRTYQFRIRTDDRFDGVAYQAEFETRAGEWGWIELPMSAFEATFRGYRVPSAPALDPADIRQISLLLADKRPGAFRLEVRDIRAIVARNRPEV